MAHIFVSYAHADRADAAALVSRLSATGHRVIWDANRIRAGQLLDERIVELIKSADYVLVLISTASRKSRWGNREITIALEREQKDTPRLVIPIVKLDTSVPRKLGERFFLGLSDLLNTESGFRKLNQALTERPLYASIRAGETAKRNSLDVIARVAIFKEIDRILIDRDDWAGWSDEWPLGDEAQNSSWTPQMYAGIVSACRFIHRCHAVVRWDREDDQRNLWFFTALIFPYLREILPIVPDRFRALDFTLLDEVILPNSEYGPPEKLRRELIESCPPTDAVDYILGWKSLVGWLHAQIDIDMASKKGRLQQSYLDKILDILWQSIIRFERSFDLPASKFWRLAESVVEDAVFPKAGSPRSSEVQEIVSWFDRELKLSSLLQEKRALYVKTPDRLLLNMRAEYIFSGSLRDDGGVFLIVERSPVLSLEDEQ